MTATRGIKKVNERILSEGRAIIVTEKDKDKYNWSDIPVGSIFVDNNTGMFMSKIEGESDWVPSGVKSTAVTAETVFYHKWDKHTFYNIGDIVVYEPTRKVYKRIGMTMGAGTTMPSIHGVYNITANGSLTLSCDHPEDNIKAVLVLDNEPTSVTYGSYVLSQLAVTYAINNTNTKIKIINETNKDITIKIIDATDASSITYDWIESDWEEIPLDEYIENGAFVSRKTEYKNDGTICISKDAIVREESYEIINIDKANNIFTYEDKDGNRKVGEFTSDGYMVFEINYEYQLYRNLLEVYVDNVLKRTVSNGGLREIDYTRFAILEELVKGQIVTIKYAQVNRIGNPYPRWYIHKDEPVRAEIGDMWLDPDSSIDDPLDDDFNYVEGKYLLPWEQVTGKPTTLQGFGLDKEAALKTHYHYKKDIIDFPSEIPAKGGESDNSDMVDYCHAGINPGNVFKIPSDGKILNSMLPNHTHDASQINNLVINPFVRGMIMMWYGNSKNVPSGWAICNGSNGTPDLRHKFVEGCDNDEIGTHMQAGLPNVTGTFGVWKMDPLTNGAFSQKQDRDCNSKNGGGDLGWTVDLDASRSSVIYGNSTTVQPEAIKMHFIMKL